MSIDLHECLTLAEGGSAVRVDREKGIIGPVKVLGWKSANGREYLPTSVRPALYEGRRVCVGHVKGTAERSPLDTYGLLEGVSVKDSGVYADRLRLLNPKGDFEQRLLTAAESAPSLFGLSHAARGREKAGSNGRIIEAVESVESVDLVSDPATVAGLYESRNTPVKRKIKDLIEALSVRRPKHSLALKEMAEAGVMSPDAEAEVPAAEAGDADHEKAFVSGVVNAINKVLQDAVESGDWDAAMKQVGEYVKTIKKHMGKKTSDGGDGGETPAADATPESRRAKEDANLRETVAQMQAEKLVRKAAGAGGVTLSETLVESLARPGMTEAQATAVVAELKGHGAGQKPRSAGPLQTGGSTPVKESRDADIPADPKARAAWLARG